MFDGDRTFSLRDLRRRDDFDDPTVSEAAVPVHNPAPFPPPLTPAPPPTPGPVERASPPPPPASHASPPPTPARHASPTPTPARHASPTPTAPAKSGAAARRGTVGTPTPTPLPPPTRQPARAPFRNALDSQPVPTRPPPSSSRSTAEVVASRYRLEEPIGVGGMGRVYRARHLQLDKVFALKLMKTDFAGDSAAREQFYREARVASSLSHPNIVSIVDFGEDSALGAFMVMELLEGEPVTARLQTEGRFPLRLACDVILQVAEALHYIHNRQIVHCDIKADNILILPLPSSDRRRLAVKLLDFGLARIRQHGNDRAETVAGTPEYMAPERICGAQPHPSMDIYGLGVLSYELITGKRPFDGPMKSVLQAHLYEEPPSFASRMSDPPDERAETLVMKALAKDPADRQKDMAAFLYELHTLMDMLGFGRRQRGRAPSTLRVQPVKTDRDRAALCCFDRSPLPLAALTADGKVVAANLAFARFLTGQKKATVEGVNIGTTSLVEICPNLLTDLAEVQTSGKRMKRTLRLRGNDSQPVNLELSLVPGGDHAPVLFSIHRLEALP